MNSSHIQWAVNILKANGYQIHVLVPDIIQSNPWSEVCRFKTDRGFVFLKKVPPALSLETKIIKILREDYRADVPIIIADNQEHHCFLMHDAGIQLHQ